MNNPKLYREMSVPFATKGEAVAAWDKFNAGIAKLREECKIQDVVFAGTFSYVSEEGEECPYYGRGHLGDQLRAESMAAFMLGSLQSERQDFIAGFMSQGIKKGPRG